MTRRSADSAVGILTPTQLEALRSEIGQFSSKTCERGSRYTAAGRVGERSVDGSCITATVRGSEWYQTSWEWMGDTWEPDCTCPVAPDCKHAYALACCILADNRLGAAVADHSKTRPPPPPTLVQRASVLDKLRSARDPWNRQQHAEVLLQRAVAGGLRLYMSPFDKIFEEPDPDLLCWRLAQAVLQRLGADYLPAALEPYRDRPDLTARYAQQARAALAQELVQWAEQQRQTTPRQLRFVFGLHGSSAADAYVTVEARLTTPRMTDEPRTLSQLGQLRNELRRTPGLLSPDQAALLEWYVTSNAGGSTDVYYPDSATYGTVRRLNGTALRMFLARVADAGLASWATDIAPNIAVRAGTTPGGLVRLCAAPARLLPACTSRDDALWVDLLFHWPDGRQRRLDAVVYLRGDTESSQTHPSLVLADGEFSLLIEEPPLAVLERFRAAGGLPLPPEERGALVSLLAAHFPHLQDTLAAHTKFHPVQAVIALDLRNEDWLQLRVFAQTGTDGWHPGQPVQDETVVFEYVPQRRWVRPAAARPEEIGAQAFEDIAAATATEAEASPATRDASVDDGSPSDVWMEAPDLQAVEPALQWLAATGAESGAKNRPGGRQPPWADRAVGWWMQASPKRMHAFADLWEQRPAGVLFFGTERVRRLLRGEERVTPILRVEASGVDWFSVSAEWEAEGLQLTDADLGKLRAATTRFVKLSSGWVRRDVAALHDETAEVLADLGIEAGAGEQRLSVWQLASARPESLAALARFGADATTLRAAKALRKRVASFTGLPHVPPPAGCTAELRPYQQLGLDFLAYTASLGIGAVLADDMGLGKTIEALAWLLHLRDHEPDGGPSLVVCPASVVYNWQRELERFAPGLRVLLLTRGETRHRLRHEIPLHDVIVTNYALLRRDLDAWRDVDLRALVLDEAQNIKNPDAAVTRAASALRARHRLALTGTPLENRALDLWSILHVVNPGYLGGRARFESRFDRLDAPPHVRTLLAAKLRPVLLRRTKKEVAPELPERIEERLDCELTKGQRQLYLAELRRSRALIEQLSSAPGGITQNKIHVLAALTRLRQICCHPALAGGKATLGSGKFDALFELLVPLLAEGHKVLLFSQFVECLKRLQTEMRTQGIPYHMLTGQTVKRQQVVDAFQNDPQACVFLISLKAGGTGLNLTAASYVVLFDPWWNPAVEAQAIDRTHRIGQDHTVIAYRMLATGTIEEKIWELQQGKAALARDILGEGGFARALTRNDLDFLLAET
jgi:superfamily II DNA or RNA helicase